MLRNFFEKKDFMIIKKRKKMIAILLAIIVFITTFLLWQNNSIVVTRINITNVKIPDVFTGYNIVHISDLHNKKFGKNQSVILRKIVKEKPDIILITGDLIDKNKTDIGVAMEFIYGAINICPIYYVTGNHEKLSGVYSTLSQLLINAGVIVLENAKTVIEKEQQKIEILGVQDPQFSTNSYSDAFVVDESLKSLTDSNDNTFKILLSHRPELIETYAKNEIDLVFSGHAHGGQIRLPIIGGLFSPNQGIFPEYTKGVYYKENTSMVVSRGLGNSIFPFRIFNRPEIIVVTLSKT
jgi:hypothetical protein